ncbi:MAG TPA: hypothetical protein VK110_07415 [Salinisphaeraceae bacterium]|nr:hypothetical protein [Salinisphaeraceae bacterium]
MVFKLLNSLTRLLAVILLATPALSASATPPAAADFGQPVPDAELAQHRGGQAVTFNTQYLDAHLADNLAAYNLTGSNQVSGHAFAGTSGIPTVIQNSGNNVIIQNATILNVSVQ